MTRGGRGYSRWRWRRWLPLPCDDATQSPAEEDAPVEPVAHVGEVGPLHPRLVQGAQQPAAGQGERGGGEGEPLLPGPGVPARLRGVGRAPALWRQKEPLLPLLLLLLFPLLLLLLLEVPVLPDGSGTPLLPEVLAADVLEDGEAERVEQEVPGLVLLLHEAAGRQAERVAHRARQQEDVQLRQGPSAAATAAAAATAPALQGKGRQGSFQLGSEPPTVHTANQAIAGYCCLPKG